MRIIAESTLERAIDYHHDRGVEDHLQSWKSYVKREIYKDPGELKVQFKNAKIINAKRVVFKIKGNQFRLVVDIEYRMGIIFVVDFLTHEEYDKIDVATITYNQSKFYR